MYIYAGTNYDQQQAREYLTIGDVYEVEDVIMGQWNTSIYLKDIPGCFNSVLFIFLDKNGDEVDIYNEPEYNPYL